MRVVGQIQPAQEGTAKECLYESSGMAESGELKISNPGYTQVNGKKSLK